MTFEIKNLSGGYYKKNICSNISCSLEKGDVLCVLGPNGCGKSTFFKLILGLLKTTSGDIFYENKSIFNLNERKLAKIIAYIPQEHTPTFNFTVLEIVLFGRTSYYKNFGGPTKIDVDIARQSLEKLNILHLQNVFYTTLSGGQRQLILIARALCQEAKILILDEPTANLDYKNSQIVMKIILKLSKMGYIIILSTHSPEQPFLCANKVLLMNNGEIFDYGDPFDVLNSKNLKEIYEIDIDIVETNDRYGNLRTLCFPVFEEDI